MYQKNVENGHIVSVTSGVSSGNITEEEYNAIMEAIKNKPEPMDGYGYTLLENLSWELYELPESTEIQEEATEADYIAALAELGVTLDEEI